MGDGAAETDRERESKWGVGRRGTHRGEVRGGEEPLPLCRASLPGVGRGSIQGLLNGPPAPRPQPPPPGAQRLHRQTVGGSGLPAGVSRSPFQFSDFRAN